MPHTVISNITCRKATLSLDGQVIGRLQKKYRHPLFFLTNLFSYRQSLFNLSANGPKEKIEITQLPNSIKDTIAWTCISTQGTELEISYTDLWNYSTPSFTLLKKNHSYQVQISNNNSVSFKQKNKTIQKVTLQRGLSRKIIQFERETSDFTPLEIASISFLLYYISKW